MVLTPGEDGDEGVERDDGEVDGRGEEEVAYAGSGGADTVAPADVEDEVDHVEDRHRRLSSQRGCRGGRGGGLTGTRQIHPVTSSIFRTNNIQTSRAIAPASCGTRRSIAMIRVISSPRFEIGAALRRWARSIFALTEWSSWT